MSDFFERHLAAARCYQDGEGTASAALCKFHNDTAAEIERLTARNEHLEKRFDYLEGDWERRNHIIELLIAHVKELEAEVDEWKGACDPGVD